MANLSKDTSGVILPFDAYGTHLDASNKIVTMELEMKNFKAAGEILAEIWLESIINGHLVKMAYIDSQERNIDTIEMTWTGIAVHATNSKIQ